MLTLTDLFCGAGGSSSGAVEVWLPVPGWEGIYEARSRGRIRSLHRTVLRGGHYMRVAEKFLSPNVHNSGYLRVNLSCEGRRSEQLIHWIIAAAFHGPRPEGLEIRHLDGDPTNNCSANLRYGTSAENKDDIRRHGTNAMRNRTHCPLGHPLKGANLMAGAAKKGYRKCRCCNAARARVYRGASGDKTLKQIADEYFTTYSLTEFLEPPEVAA